MKAAFLLVLLVAAVAAQEAATLFSLENYNDPEILRAIADAQEPTYSLCNADAAYPFTVQRLIVQPFPLQKGNPAEMILIGDANSQISLKQIKVTTMVKTVSINTRYISEAGKNVTAGENRLTVDVTIPSYAPAGSYTIQLDVQDVTGASVTCMNIPITLS